MPADYAQAVQCLQENLVLLNGKMDLPSQALWNISNALLVLVDGIAALEKKNKLA